MTLRHLNNSTVIAGAKSNITVSQIDFFTEHGHYLLNKFLTEVSREYRKLAARLWEMYEQDPKLVFSDSFITVLDQSKSFKQYIINVYLAAFIDVQPPVSFFVDIFVDCYDNYKNNKEVGALKWVEGANQVLLISYYKTTETPENFQEIEKYVVGLQQSLDVTENIHNSRVIYADDYLALTYNTDVKGLGELAFAVKAYGYLWSFDKVQKSVPVKSLRNAKKAFIEYKGKPRKGQLIGNDSIRFAQFLGLQIKDNYAYMNKHPGLSNHRGKGFS